MDHLPWYAKLFFALGGAAVIWAAVAKGARSVGKLLMSQLLKFPWFHDVVVANKDRIKQILADFEKGEEDAVDEANGKSEPPQPTTPANTP